MARMTAGTMTEPTTDTSNREAELIQWAAELGASSAS